MSCCALPGKLLLSLAQSETSVRILHDLFALVDIIYPVHVGHKDPRFARYIGTLVPVVAGVPQSLVSEFLDPQVPRFLSFCRCLNAGMAVPSHVVQTFADPIHVLLDSGYHVCQYRRAPGACYREQIWES